MDSPERHYQRLTVACAAYGIKRSQAFKLAKQGALETFTIGKSRFVFLDSLRSLPDRLAANEVMGEDAA